MVFIIPPPNNYKTVMFGKTNFSRDRLEAGQRKRMCENNWRIVSSSDRRSLAFSAVAQQSEQPGQIVDLKTLPASVQQTINQKAAGGEIVRVKRKDDANGRWNYEVVVRMNGKESGFEVDPNGKLLKQHSAIKK